MPEYQPNSDKVRGIEDVLKEMVERVQRLERTYPKSKPNRFPSEDEIQTRRNLEKLVPKRLDTMTKCIAAAERGNRIPLLVLTIEEMYAACVRSGEVPIGLYEILLNLQSHPLLIGESGEEVRELEAEALEWLQTYWDSENGSTNRIRGHVMEVMFSQLKKMDEQTGFSPEQRVSFNVSNWRAVTSILNRRAKQDRKKREFSY